MSAETLLGPEPLDPGHAAGTFDCGVPSLNEYLRKRAIHDQNAEKSRTYVVCADDRVVGFFSLAASSVEAADATERLARGQGTQAIPVVLLGRLAVDRGYQGKGLGEALLVQALLKSASAADTIGARAVLVHAVDERTKAFYAKYGFETSPTEPLHLMMLMKDIRKTLDV